MIELEPPFRIATEADAPQLAELVNIAGEGLPLHLWQGMAGEAEDPWKIGRARQLAKTKESQIIVADFGNGAVASLTGYGIGAEPEPILADLSPILRPLLELENLALDSWYVNVLASFPDHRGKGLGSSLLNLAEQIVQATTKRPRGKVVDLEIGGAISHR